MRSAIRRFMALMLSMGIVLGLSSFGKASLVYDEAITGDLALAFANSLSSAPHLGPLAVGVNEVRGAMAAASTGAGDIDAFRTTLPAGMMLSATLTIDNYQAPLGSGGTVELRLGAGVVTVAPVSSIGGGSGANNGTFNFDLVGHSYLAPRPADTDLVILLTPPQRNFSFNPFVNGAGGADWTVRLSVIAVPEPSSLALVAVSTMGLGRLPRRRARN